MPEPPGAGVQERRLKLLPMVGPVTSQLAEATFWGAASLLGVELLAQAVNKDSKPTLTRLAPGNEYFMHDSVLFEVFDLTETRLGFDARHKTVSNDDVYPTCRNLIATIVLSKSYD